MMKARLFTDGSNYYAPQGANCDACTNPVEGMGWHLIRWYAKSRKRHAEEFVYCYDCKSHIRAMGADMPELKLIFISPPPKGSIPWFAKPTVLGDARPGGMSLFEAVNYKGGTADSPAVNDESRLRLSGRPEGSWLLEDGSTPQIGLSPDLVRNPDDDPDPLALLTAEPIIPKYLEDNT